MLSSFDGGLALNQLYAESMSSGFFSVSEGFGNVTQEVLM